MALFTAADAREFVIDGETPLSGFAGEQLEEAEGRIAEAFQDICGVAFSPTSETDVAVDGGRAVLLLPHTRIVSLDAVSVGGTAFGPQEMDDLIVYPGGLVYRPGGWSPGVGNVTVSYTHGYENVPKRIKWAALVVAVEELTGNDINSRAISHTDELGTVRLSTPDGVNRWYGIPSVDSILAQYRVKVPAIG